MFPVLSDSWGNLVLGDYNVENRQPRLKMRRFSFVILLDSFADITSLHAAKRAFRFSSSLRVLEGSARWEAPGHLLCVLPAISLSFRAGAAAGFFKLERPA